jgi:hypothetical protein
MAVSGLLVMSSNRLVILPVTDLAQQGRDVAERSGVGFTMARSVMKRGTATAGGCLR